MRVFVFFLAAVLWAAAIYILGAFINNDWIWGNDVSLEARVWTVICAGVVYIVVWVLYLVCDDDKEEKPRLTKNCKNWAGECSGPCGDKECV